MLRTELERVRRVSDMMCTAHAILRDKYKNIALSLDLIILTASAWLTAMVFVEPRIGVRLSPPGVDKEMGIGIIAIGTFILSIIQLKVDWKGRSDAHQRTCELFADIKRQSGYLLTQSNERTLSVDECKNVLDRYGAVGALGISIPDNKFNKLKRHHKMKVEISKYLDTNPGTSILLLKIKIWFRDNIKTLK